MRPRPTPPRPDLVRRPRDNFGWLDARLLQEGWLARLGGDGVAVLTLLAIAADRRGASFYSRQRMASALALDLPAVDRALAKLRELGLVDARPWRAGNPDGVWQLLPLPEQVKDRRRQSHGPVAMAVLLRRLGFHAE